MSIANCMTLILSSHEPQLLTEHTPEDAARCQEPTQCDEACSCDALQIIFVRSCTMRVPRSSYM